MEEEEELPLEGQEENQENPMSLNFENQENPMSQNFTEFCHGGICVPFS